MVVTISDHSRAVRVRHPKEIHAMIDNLVDTLHAHDFTDFGQQGFRHLVGSFLIVGEPKSVYGCQKMCGRFIGCERVFGGCRYWGQYMV